MKYFNFGTLLLVAAIGLMAWGTYDILFNQPINADNCGVSIAPVEPKASVTSLTMSAVPLRLTNRSNGPVRIVGNDAC